MFRKLIKYVFIILITIFFMFAGFFTGLAISQFLQSNFYSLISIITAIFFVGTSIIIALYLQNAGKLVVGKLLGYKLISSKLNDFVMVPSNERVGLTAQFLYHSGGIIADLLGGLLCIILFKADPWQFNNLYRLLILSVAAGLILTACINLTSYFSSDKPNDGKIIWSIISGNPSIKEYLMDINITTLIEEGVRPADIPMDKLNEEAHLPEENFLDTSTTAFIEEENRPAKLKKNKLNKDTLSPYDMKLALYLYKKALDANQPKYVLHFSRFLEKNILAAPDEINTDAKMELCFMNCLMGRNTEAADYYNDIKDILENSFDMTSLRVRAYYELYINQNKDNAVFYAKAALDFKDQIKFKGYIPMEEQLLNDIISRI